MRAIRGEGEPETCAELTHAGAKDTANRFVPAQNIVELAEIVGQDVTAHGMHLGLNRDDSSPYHPTACMDPFGEVQFDHHQPEDRHHVQESFLEAR
jgi:hypothetical protein